MASHSHDVLLVYPHSHRAQITDLVRHMMHVGRLGVDTYDIRTDTASHDVVFSDLGLLLYDTYPFAIFLTEELYGLERMTSLMRKLVKARRLILIKVGEYALSQALENFVFFQTGENLKLEPGSLDRLIERCKPKKG